MYAKVQTGVMYGMNAETVTVESDLASGLPSFNVVGLADLSVREAKERIRSALQNEGYHFPTRRITVNLAPAGRKKEGTHFDLPIAISVLASSGRIPPSATKGYALIGELSLDGTVNGVSCVLPMLIGLQQSGVRRIILPQDSLREAMMLSELLLYPVRHLAQVVAHLDGTAVRTPLRAQGKGGTGRVEPKPDFGEVLGQETVKRVITAAGAARHGLLLVGPPGVGKTMLCRRIPGILPEMSYEEQLEVTKIYSVAGRLNKKNPIVTVRPFRAPHHSLSAAAFLGGGAVPKPGEISLAHRGVLFLDELPEFTRKILELLRTPMEEGSVTISRTHGNYVFPAQFMLVAAMNPCRCGYLGDETHRCSCSDRQLQAYQEKLSGPLLDRIDIHVEMAPVTYQSLEETTGPILTSARMREQVLAARQIQTERYRGEKILYNSELTPALIKKYCVLSSPCKDLLQEAFHHYGLSVRGKDKLLRLSRTLADLSGSPQIETEHLAEALQYRCMDRRIQSGR